jgi:manganese-dependent inorganic pyrophosphatase
MGENISPDGGASMMTRSVSQIDIGALAQKAYDTTDSGVHLSRERTMLEHEVIARHDAAEALIGQMRDDPTRVYFPSMLNGALFCGHLVTDMDSIAGAIGAADLYGGQAARASQVNSETRFCLDKWGVPEPPPIELMLEKNPDAGVCLVDHQQTSQVNPAIPHDRIVGVIDHHALQSETIVTEMPIFIDIRPWGSMSTIIAHGYLTRGRKPSPPIAGMLLCAIISDTLNLQGPTTTNFDRSMVSILAILAGVEDINLLSSQQFKAKSRELAGLSPTQLVCGDQKVFKLKSEAASAEYKLGFAVVETTDDAVILDRSAELLLELTAVKTDRALDFLFFAVVNIVEMRSNLLLCGAAEGALAKLAFGEPMSAGGTRMDLGKRVSRKKEFIPPLTASMRSFAMEAVDLSSFEGAAGASVGEEDIIASSPKGQLTVDPADPYARVVRRFSPSPKRRRGGEEPVAPKLSLLNPLADVAK